MAKKESSVAPKERINVTFKPAIGDAQEEIEIPFKLMVLGDFTQRPDDRALEERKPVSIDKNTFNDVLEKQNLDLNISVPNRLQDEDPDSELAVNLQFKNMKDFDPANIVERVPELKKLMELRDALVALKGPLGNAPAFRKAIESVLADDESLDKVLKELGLSNAEKMLLKIRKEISNEF
ncbi:type VI secretion system contractile sheath small subunit [Gammaproteobacteria bacterium ESL0073]|nr:type VI secretion system contractile sheath small subunit [Gammaproteobacteria bacterium ESL0073]